MKVLEIHGFRRWAENYEGDHEVVRWMGRDRHGTLEDKGVVARLADCVNFSRFLERANPDLVVCQCFGGAYVGGRLRRTAKYSYERALVAGIVRGIKATGLPFAVTDVADDITIHPVNRSLLDCATFYFKRELPLDPFHALEAMRARPGRAPTGRDRAKTDWQRWVEKLRPLPLGCRQAEPSGERIPVSEKRWDVFYVGGDDLRPRREGIRKQLAKLERQGLRVLSPSAPMEFEEYIEAMRNSILALSPPGLGWDCHRHYEAAMVGTIPVTPFPVIHRHAPLLDQVHGFLLDPEKNIAEQIVAKLVDQDRLECISRSLPDWIREHHTHRAHFDYVVRTTVGFCGSGLM